ncbi:hypothetical protein K2173_028320 [Erythroxylum novogranatense]|uniref:phosphoserine phosphatase n=1 Tax=Erythroxylum novogranatense TaxID=1862640 RepID=A0AAV8U1S7_9ROSI|nr:hypothetical protein K2173_028320 [Erythroxylum novogranatense]
MNRFDFYRLKPKTLVPSSSSSLPSSLRLRLRFPLHCQTHDSSMERLMQSRIKPINPVHATYGVYRSRFIPLVPIQLAEKFPRSSCLVMDQRKSFNSVVASVQPLKASTMGHFDNALPSKEVLDVWRTAEAVCFDVDSTVCQDEGIDELADFCGAGKAVAEWTARAMGGSVSFEEALAARLSLFKPSLSQVQDFLEKQPPKISPGIDELVKKLKAKKKDVYLISGGFRQMINPVAAILGISPKNIFANQLLFGNSGEFVGFDANEPTSKSGGKATAVQQIRKVHGYKVLVMIGDGATDLEARKPGGADLFICYAGVQLRAAVAAKADWLVFNFTDMINSLE